jgi:hypothetical protein
MRAGIFIGNLSQLKSVKPASYSDVMHGVLDRTVSSEARVVHLIAVERDQRRLLAVYGCSGPFVSNNRNVDNHDIASSASV